MSDISSPEGVVTEWLSHSSNNSVTSSNINKPRFHTSVTLFEGLRTFQCLLSVNTSCCPILFVCRHFITSNCNLLWSRLKRKRERGKRSKNLFWYATFLSSLHIKWRQEACMFYLFIGTQDGNCETSRHTVTLMYCKLSKERCCWWKHLPCWLQIGKIYLFPVLKVFCFMELKSKLH